ncbi:MAG: glycosyltransferase family 2 protein [Janthinobacterium lividum]
MLPAYNAVSTLERTVAEIPRDIVDDVILTDDYSSDATADLSRRLGLHTIRHDRNRGYGGNQKTCYAAALARGADIVVMLHPDYQYSPKLVTAMASMIASGHYDVVLGSRILGNGALSGGMPLYKYLANRGLTLVENVLVGQTLSEYHTGYRAWSRHALERLPILRCSDDFVFDNQMLAQAISLKFNIGEISCPRGISRRHRASTSAAASPTDSACSTPPASCSWTAPASRGQPCSRTRSRAACR